MMSLMEYCQRCEQQDVAYVTSRFNTDRICLKCEKKEKAHPDYRMAVKAEEDAIRSGDFNYRGIGKPSYL